MWQTTPANRREGVRGVRGAPARGEAAGWVTAKPQITAKVLDHLRSALDYWAREGYEYCGRVAGVTVYFPIAQHGPRQSDFRSLVGRAIPGVLAAINPPPPTRITLAHRLAKLPADEGEALTRLWADVAALLQKAEEEAK